MTFPFELSFAPHRDVTMVVGERWTCHRFKSLPLITLSHRASLVNSSRTQSLTQFNSIVVDEYTIWSYIGHVLRRPLTPYSSYRAHGVLQLIHDRLKVGPQHFRHGIGIARGIIGIFVIAKIRTMVGTEICRFSSLAIGRWVTVNGALRRGGGGSRTIVRVLDGSKPGRIVEGLVGNVGIDEIGV